MSQVTICELEIGGLLKMTWKNRSVKNKGICLDASFQKGKLPNIARGGVIV